MAGVKLGKVAWFECVEWPMAPDEPMAAGAG